MNVVIAAIQTNEWQEDNWWFLVVQPSSPQSNPQGLINDSITIPMRVLLHDHTSWLFISTPNFNLLFYAQGGSLEAQSFPLPVC